MAAVREFRLDGRLEPCPNILACRRSREWGVDPNKGGPPPSVPDIDPGDDVVPLPGQDLADCREDPFRYVGAGHVPTRLDPLMP